MNSTTLLKKMATVVACLIGLSVPLRAQLGLKEPSSDPAVLRAQFRALHEKIAEGDPTAEVTLRTWKRRGVGKADLYINIAILERQAKRTKDPTLQGRLAAAYMLGQGGIDINMPLAIELMEKASAAGDALSSYNLGVAYNDAVGVAKNKPKARQYYLLAAKQGRPDALLSVGNMERDAQNYDEAVNWYAQAADQGARDGYKKAAEVLRWKDMPPEKRKRGLGFLEKAAACGDFRSTYEAAVAYYEGEPGTPPDRQLAARYFSRALEDKWAGRVHEFFYREEADKDGKSRKPARIGGLQELASQAKNCPEFDVLVKKLDRHHKEKLRGMETAGRQKEGKK